MNSGQDRVTVEFFGIPRRRAGRAEITMASGTVARVLSAVRAACPGLADSIGPDGALSAHCVLSLDGVRFLTNPDEVVPPGSRLLLLTADVGG